MWSKQKNKNKRTKAASAHGEGWDILGQEQRQEQQRVTAEVLAATEQEACRHAATNESRPRGSGWRAGSKGNGEFVLVLWWCTILHSFTLGQKSHKHTQCWYKLLVGRVRLRQGWARNLSLIPLPGLMHLYDELIMRFYWYYFNVQSYLHSCVFGQHSHKTTQCCYKYGVGFVECGEIRQ